MQAKIILRVCPDRTERAVKAKYAMLEMSHKRLGVYISCMEDAIADAKRDPALISAAYLCPVLLFEDEIRFGSEKEEEQGEVVRDALSGRILEAQLKYGAPFLVPAQYQVRRESAFAAWDGQLYILQGLAYLHGAIPDTGYEIWTEPTITVDYLLEVQRYLRSLLSVT